MEKIHIGFIVMSLKLMQYNKAKDSKSLKASLNLFRNFNDDN